MLVISHRGFRAGVPENTLAAFERAVALGVDGIETDVRMTADGIAVLFHDRCVRPGLDRIADLSHREIEARVGHPVPTLEGAVAAFADILWNLEIKTPAAAAAVVDLVRRYASTRRFLVTSFHHPVVATVVAETSVRGGLLTASAPIATENLLSRSALDPRIDTVVWDYEICTPGLVAAAARQGFANLVYGAATRREHEEAAAWGIDGLITDDPRLVCRAD
jgi:glycerophosphoryl diester phosphodiesterase